MTVAKRWLLPPPITQQADTNLAAFHPVLRQLLFNRGFATEAEARAFMRAEPDFDTDPLQLKGMDVSVDRITSAIHGGETIAIYGDYDVDGVTATALLADILQHLGAHVLPYIPNRFDEGYGLNIEALDTLKSGGARLVITVDCGIRSSKEAQYARDIGLDLIVSDHHHPAGDELPPAFAIVNPKQPGDKYPDKDLAGVGIAYKIAEALSAQQPGRLELENSLDLVALGTVADLAPLTGENRALVRRGLQAIRQTRRQGLFSLANAAQMTIGKTTASQIGFVLGPRLNAAGRLKSAEAALDLLTTSDAAHAGLLAQELDSYNRERQALTREMQEKAEALATAGESHPALLFAADEGFNSGVVGLAAARLTEAYYRPAVVASKGAADTRGSCRSIPEFHITDALDQCTDILIRHGGHAAAAGFTVRNEHLPELESRLKSLAEAQLGGLDLRPTVSTDMEVDLSTLSFELLRELGQLEPTGYGNPDAVFVSRQVDVRASRTVGADRRHLKLTLQDERGVTMDAIGFRLGHLQANLPRRVDVAYKLEANEYNGRTTLQLNLRDVQAPGEDG
jgi:single-stranded-DNA-specific exonuclease